MMQYDLTDTPLARATKPMRVPSEGELLVIVVGLLIAQRRTLTEMAEAGESLVLDEGMCDQLVGLLSQELSPLERELGIYEPPRARLAQLVGMRIALFR